VSESGLFRRIFGLRNEVTGGWRKLHNEELHNLYSSPAIIRMTKLKENEMGGACSSHFGDDKCILNIVWRT
jgi:hypothetical protein